MLTVCKTSLPKRNHYLEGLYVIRVYDDIGLCGLVVTASNSVSSQAVRSALPAVKNYNSTGLRSKVVILIILISKIEYCKIIIVIMKRQAYNSLAQRFKMI